MFKTTMIHFAGQFLIEPLFSWSVLIVTYQTLMLRGHRNKQTKVCKYFAQLSDFDFEFWTRHWVQTVCQLDSRENHYQQVVWREHAVMGAYNSKSRRGTEREKKRWLRELGGDLVKEKVVASGALCSRLILPRL